MATLRSYQLSDNLGAGSGTVFLTGTQALVRLLLLQKARDAAAGQRTAGFVSGYRGSPLGMVDQQLWKAKKFLDAAEVRFLPAINEDLAATAVLGTQRVALDEQRRVEGVFAMWYGKGPGVDRSRRRAQARQRLRFSQPAGRRARCLPVTTTAACPVVDAAPERPWPSPGVAACRCCSPRQCGRIPGVRAVRLRPLSRYSAATWVGMARPSVGSGREWRDRRPRCGQQARGRMARRRRGARRDRTPRAGRAACTYRLARLAFVGASKVAPGATSWPRCAAFAQAQFSIDKPRHRAVRTAHGRHRHRAARRITT